jgi:hypothetical protein
VDVSCARESLRCMHIPHLPHFLCPLLCVFVRLFSCLCSCLFRNIGFLRLQARVRTVSPCPLCSKFAYIV